MKKNIKWTCSIGKVHFKKDQNFIEIIPSKAKISVCYK
jgi:hypothetical protein